MSIGYDNIIKKLSGDPSLMLGMTSSFGVNMEKRAGLCEVLCNKKMRSNIQYIIFLMLLFPALYVEGQEITVSEVITNIVEELAAGENDPETAARLVEQLYELSERPVPVNSADKIELSRLFFLSEFQINSLEDYIINTGNIVSIYEIASIPGFDRSTAEMIKPFITLEKSTENTGRPVRWNNNLITSLIMKPGENDTSLLGSPLRFLTKYKLTAGRLEGGFTMEKDPGEKFLTGSPPVTDFLSAHLSYTGKGVVKKIILGDFSARFGEGVNVNTGIRTGLLLTSRGYMSARNEIRPYTSTDENNFFRGAAAYLAIKNLDLFVFYSSNRIDATPVFREDSSFNSVENLYRTGLHTTSSQIIKKDILSERACGINLAYNLTSMKIGLTWSRSYFTLPLAAAITDPVKQFDFNDRRNDIFSFYYKKMIKRILLFGEISANNIEDIAVVQGMTIRPSDRLTVNLLYRDYGRGFTSFHGNGPGNSSGNSNERGMLGNFTFEAAKNLFISAGYDLASYPWLKYRCSFPSLSKRDEIRINYLPSENLTFELLFTSRYSMYDNHDDPGVSGISELRTHAFRGNVKYTLNNNLTMVTRLDCKVATTSGSTGMMMIQDMICRFSKSPLTFWFRYCIFSTDDWDSRLYAYENDLLYSFSIPALSGKGIRSYLMAKWEPGKFTELRVKYGLTTLIKSADITENQDELKLQFRFWF